MEEFSGRNGEECAARCQADCPAQHSASNTENLAGQTSTQALSIRLYNLANYRERGRTII